MNGPTAGRLVDQEGQPSPASPLPSVVVAGFVGNAGNGIEREGMAKRRWTVARDEGLAFLVGRVQLSKICNEWPLATTRDLPELEGLARLGGPLDGSDGRRQGGRFCGEGLHGGLLAFSVLPCPLSLLFDPRRVEGVPAFSFPPSFLDDPSHQWPLTLRESRNVAGRRGRDGARSFQHPSTDSHPSSVLAAG